MDKEKMKEILDPKFTILEKFIETYNEWDIYQDVNNRFFICGKYLGEETCITESSLEEMKNFIDCL